MYNIGDTIVVDKIFEYDGIDFFAGDRGTIIEIDRFFIAISWENKHDPEFHDYNGHHSTSTCWCIPDHVLKKKAHVEVLKEANGNPLPEDPRLRGIALKIIQLDNKFKRYQELKKSGQLHLLDKDRVEEEDGYDEVISLADYETVRG